VVGAADVVSVVEEEELRLLLEIEEDFEVPVLLEDLLLLDEVLLLDIVFVLEVKVVLEELVLIVEDVLVDEAEVFELDFKVVALLLEEEEEVRR